MNQLLEKTQEKVLESINAPQLEQAVKKVESAGHKVMYSEQTRDMLIEQLNEEGDLPEIIGAGIAKLAGLLLNQSKNTIPMNVLVPAATLLLMEGLDFLEQAGKVQITNDLIAECTQAMASNLLQLLGVTPDKIQEYMSQGGVMGDAAEPELEGGEQAIDSQTTASAEPAGIVAAARGGM